MKLLQQEDRIQIVDGPTNVDAIIRDLTNRSTANDEPFYVFDIGDIVRKHQNWIEKMPRVIPHYAVKCNDNELVLATLAALGTSFDCASKVEISKILQLGVNADRIIFANPMKPASHLRHAHAVNVKTMTYDSEIELQKIKAYCPDAKLVLRIRCDAEVAQCPLGKKFGCDPMEGPHLIKAARALNLEVVGISFHVGSGCQDYPIYYKAIQMAKNLFNYAETIGYEFNLLDIGGGFPGDKGKTIDEVAKYVNQGLEEFFPDKSVKVIAEPGRYYVASAFTLVCNVQSKRICLNAKTGAIDRIMYYINDGVYGSFNSILYDHQHQQPKLLDQPLDEKEYDSTIWGPTCDALDQIIETIRLPELNIDDWVIFENMGAYTIPVASPFNGFPLPKIQSYVNEDVWEMLKNLIPEDIFTVHSVDNGLNNMVYENVVCA